MIVERNTIDWAPVKYTIGSIDDFMHAVNGLLRYKSLQNTPYGSGYEFDTHKNQLSYATS